MEPGWDWGIELHKSRYQDVGLCAGVGGGSSDGIGGSVGVDDTHGVGSGGGVGFGDIDGAGSVGRSCLWVK